MTTYPMTPAQLLEQERAKYPGLLPREVIVLREWLKLHEHEYDSFDYNFRLGQGFDPGPAYEQYLRDYSIKNTQKRVDAVAYKGSVATLIEVKDRAGFSAIGQLIGYYHLWQEQYPEKVEPLMLMVCNRVPVDVLPVLRRAGISLAIVEASYAELAGLRARHPLPR